MNILLIWPNYGEERIEYVPIALAYLKANLDPLDHEVRILDTVLENLSPGSDEFIAAVTAHQFDLVGFSCTSNKFANTVAFAKQIKAQFPTVPIVIGGVHVTSYPDESMQYTCFDYAIAGEAERSFPKFLAALHGNDDLSAIPGLCFRSPLGLRRNPVDRPPELDEIRMPDYRDIELDRYYRLGYQFIHDKMDHAPMWISRGCPYACKFCASPQLNGKRMRYHSADYVESFVRSLHSDLGVNHVNIIDDNFTFDLECSKIILRRLIALRNEMPTLSFAFPNGIRMQRVDREILNLMKKAGFTYVVYAPESGSPTVLKLMRKGLRAEQITPAMQLAKAAGLKVMSFWVTGYPGETKDTLEETRRMIHACGADMFSLHRFCPLPGTPIFDQLVAAGKIERSYLPSSYQNTSDLDYVADGLTREDLASFARRVYIEHYILRPWNALTQLRITGFSSIPKRVVKLIMQT